MSYEILPHTADLRVRAEGETLEELFRDMLRGMAAAMQSVHSNHRPTTRRIRIASADREALLVDFLNEAIALGETNRETYDDVRFEQLADTELQGELIGRPRQTIGLQVKAATHHGLRIENVGGTFSATVVFDI